MGTIVAIGGGELGLGETRLIDQEIVRLSGKTNPALLFLPTASRDAENYIDTVKMQFGALGCQVSALCLTRDGMTADMAREAVGAADIVYVGGGSTAFMMTQWQKFGVDEALKTAYARGAVLSGLSAGSICWFVAGHSDSDLIDNNGVGAYRWVNGLGLLPFVNCPHYDEPERQSFDEMVKEQDLEGIALENNVALVATNGGYAILKADPAKKAYRFFCSKGVWTKQEMV